MVQFIHTFVRLFSIVVVVFFFVGYTPISAQNDTITIYGEYTITSAINNNRFDLVNQTLCDKTIHSYNVNYNKLFSKSVFALINYYQEQCLDSLTRSGLKCYYHIITTPLTYNLRTITKAERNKILLEKRRIIDALREEGTDVYIRRLYELTGDYMYENEYDNAEAIYSEIIELCRKYGKDNTPEYAKMMYTLSMLYYNKGDYPTADYYIEIAKQINDRNRISNIEAIDFSRIIASAIGTSDQEEQELVDIYRSHQSHLGESESAWTEFDVSQSQEALSAGDTAAYNDWSKAIEENKVFAYEQRFFEFFNVAINLAKYYIRKRVYEKADAIILHTDSILHDTRLTQNILYPLIGLAKCYIETQNYSQAEILLEEANTKILQDTIKSHIIDLYETFGDLYQLQQQWKLAEQYYTQAYKEEQLQFKTYINHKSNIAVKLGKLYQIEENESLSQYYYNHSNSYYEMALAAERNGDRNSAESNFVNYVNEVRSNYGSTHPIYASALQILADFYYRHWNIDKTISLYEEILDIRKQEYLSATNYLSEHQRACFWQQYQEQISAVYPTACRQMYETRKLYDFQLFSKGLLLSSTNLIWQSIINSSDSIIQGEYRSLLALRNEINRAEVLDSTSEHIRALRRQSEALEKSVIARSAQYRDIAPSLSITWQDIQNHLPGDAIAVEFIETWGNEGKMYEMLVLHKDFKAPLLHSRLSERELQNILNTQSNLVYTYNEISQTLYKQLITPIFSDLRGQIARNRIKTIYISPTGLLHQINFDALPINAKYRMSDKYEIVRLTSTRELVLRNKEEHKESAAIYGGIQYDVDTTLLLSESKLYDQSCLLASRSIEDDTINRGSVRYLRGTKREAESINSLLSRHNIPATLYTSTAANEESFKSLSGKHQNIIHIGTHGFYWADSTARKQDYFTQRTMSQNEDMPIQYAIDPLDRCGLLFAGANMALTGHSRDLPDGVQDGILTAREISLMDLRDCDLVVLSACETAKGDITSEGVFGLQRAFKMAGVQTIIMSLWKVNDNATQMLMTEFYTNWIEKKQSKREAFRNAQNAVRYAVDEYGDRMYADPVYWAGFIMLD